MNIHSIRKDYGLILLWGGLLLCAGVSFLLATHTAASSPAAGASVPFPQEGIKLVVENRSALDYRAEPVTSGVPLPEGSGVSDTRSLYVTAGSGQIIPAQFRVLARWGALSDVKKPIKWVLVDFQADVPKKGHSLYYLKRRSPQESVIEGISTKETPDAITVSTGAIAFTLSKKHFSLFDQVMLEGAKESLLAAREGGIVITRSGREFSTAFDTPDIAIEEPGPLRTVILVRGRFRDKEGNAFVGGDARMYLPEHKITPQPENYPLTYSVRIHAYKDKSYVKVVYTLENNGNTIAHYYPVNDVFIDGNYLRLKPAVVSAPFKVTTEDGSFNAAGSDAFELQQTHSVKDQKDEAKNFLYTLLLNGKETASGKRSEGWLDFSSEKAGIALGARFFWQKYPKSIEYGNGVLQLGILPDKGGERETTGPFAHYATGNHYFSGGWHKTTEVFLYFHKAPRADADQVMARLNAPLFARCEPKWYADTEAWSLIAPAQSISSDDRLMRDAFERYELYQQMFVDKQKERNKRDIVQLRESRHMKRGHYGWEHFGDMAHGWSVFSALIYDWPYSMWLQFVRSGDLRFMDRAKEMTEHSVDLDQIHYYKPATFHDGVWHFEKIGPANVNYHHKSTQGGGAIISHTWNGGYALGYLLTGDRRYLEAAGRSAHAGRAYWSWKARKHDAIGGQKVKYDQTRSQGWTILMLVNEYKITGDRSNLQQAMAIFKNSLLYTEQLPRSPGSNGGGYILVERYPDPNIQGRGVVTFLTYPLEPLCELHYEAARAGFDTADLEAYLVRSLNWLKDYAFVGGKTNSPGRYSLLTISYATDPTNPENNKGGTLAHNIHIAGAFGYMSTALRQKEPALSIEYLSFARQLFRDLMLYKDTQKLDKESYLDPKSYSPVSWGWLGTAPKVMGYIGRGGQFYLNAEYSLQREQRK